MTILKYIVKIKIGVFMFVLTTYKAYHNWQDGKEVVASFFSYEEAKKCLPNVMTSRTLVYNNFSEYLKMKDKVLESQLISMHLNIFTSSSLSLDPSI